MPGLEHILVVGGTRAEWQRVDDRAWADQLAALGEAASSQGASWLTLRPLDDGDDTNGATRREQTVATEGRECVVIADAAAGGRAGFARAASSLDPETRVTEQAIACALYRPADVEPDLVVVLGSHGRLPVSLVWELAYAELVFAEGSWDDLGPDVIHRAATEFGSRHRRFGGIE